MGTLIKCKFALLNLLLIKSNECLVHFSRASIVLVLKYSVSSSHSAANASSSLKSRLSLYLALELPEESGLSLHHCNKNKIF